LASVSGAASSGTPESSKPVGHNLPMRSSLRVLKLFLALTVLFSGAIVVICADDHALPIEPDRGTAGLTRHLKELRTRASVLHVTAHPDDEDGGMLAYETRGVGARGALFTLNRGEGGQNAMSTDLYDALGLVRTEELLAAGRWYGVDQYFSRVIDFGFSKTREEALEKWDHDRVLSDAVRVIRMVRPLVVTSVFSGNPTDGHGQHQIAGQMAQEAYLAAGDATKFPEQIREGLRPWTPLKVYARVPFYQETPQGMYDYAIDKYVPVRFFDYIQQKWIEKQTPSTDISIDEGLLDPTTGLTYLQISRTGLGFQKSQNGGGTTPLAAPAKSEYHRYGSRVPVEAKETTFFDGIDVSLKGIATLAPNTPRMLIDGLADIDRHAAAAQTQFNATHPEAIAAELAEGLKATRSLIDEVRRSAITEPGKSDILFELNVKERQFNDALAESLNVSFEGIVAPSGPPPQNPNQGGRGAQPSFTIAIPGQKFNVDAAVYALGSAELTVERVTVLTADGKDWKASAANVGPKTIKRGEEFVPRFSVTVPEDAPLTRPYFARSNEELAYYDKVDERYRNLPLAPYPLSVRAQLSFQGVPFDLQQVVQTTDRMPGAGLLYEPLLVGPAISVIVAPSAGAVPIGSKEFDFSVLVHSNVKGAAQGVLKLKLPRGWKSTPAEAPFAFVRDGEEQTFKFSIAPAPVELKDYTITAEADYAGKTYTEGYHMTGFAGLRPYPYYSPATYRAVGVEVKTAPNLSIGFLPGTGDDVPRALENLGQNVRILSTSDLTQGNLQGYDAIILGTRAYAVRTDLKAANTRLLDYVKNGGVLIVQYNLQDFDHNYGPYPFELGPNAAKVVDENSPIAILDPNNPAFGWPNKVTAADFKGWVEERGHGFLKSWDSRYTPLVETHDPDQDPQKGGLLLARYGKGFYIYDAFALYRQLPSGVPGAYRILGNLVSLGKNPGWR
jgi:LmbE family N-acetylglucosaminyl deacetylase